MKRNFRLFGWLFVIVLLLTGVLMGADDYVNDAGVRQRSTEVTNNAKLVQVPHVLMRKATVVAASSQTATATNAAATVTIAAAGTAIRNVVDGISWSYSGGTPTGGRLTVKDGATTVWDIDITSAGAGFVPVVRKGTANTAMTVVLADGGAAIVGKVNADRVYTE